MVTVRVTGAGEVSSASGTVWNAGSEAEYLDGKIYVWQGGYNGAQPDGSDSFLHVYDVAGDTWSATSDLAASEVMPGFRSGAFDIWGVNLASDPEGLHVFVSGGERNKLVYAYEVASDSWKVLRTAVYDGGWGASIEYVAGSRALYQIDGRNSTSTPQGTAVAGPRYGVMIPDRMPRPR